MKHIFKPSVFSSKLALLSAAVVLLVGCAPLPNQAFSVPTPHQSQGPLVAWAVEHTAGSRTVLEDPEFGGKISASLEQEYRAASGLLCKSVRLRTERSFGEEVAVCQAEGVAWFLARRIWGSMGQQGTI
jgi:17 kDa common-antigen outer membrane protein